jgi:anti-sigma factor RsiW
MKHIDRWLVAYVEGQLPPRRAERVREHVARCPACRDKLVRHERLSADLRLTLACTPEPRLPQILHWWQVIRRPVSVPASLGIARAILPVLLSLILLALPLTTGLGTAAAASVEPPPVAPDYEAEGSQPVATPESRAAAVAAEIDVTPSPPTVPIPALLTQAKPPTP